MRHELFDVIESDEIRQCPNCKAKVSGRANKIYCSSNCRKRGTETKRNSQFSPTKRRENLEFFDRALRLAEELYKTPPPQRLEFMRDLMHYARTGEDRVRGISYAILCCSDQTHIHRGSFSTEDRGHIVR